MVDNISLNEQEVDALRILLYLEDDSSTVQSLARASEFFKDYATKEELTTVQEWVLDNLSMTESETWLEVNNLTKCVTI